MKSPTSSQGVVRLSGLLGLSPSWGFKAEYKKDETLVREQTSSIVARPLQYTETGSRIDLGP